MRCVLIVLALAVPAGTAWPQQSPPCSQALEALQAAEDAALEAGRAGAGAKEARLREIQSLRARAERACLGGRSGPPPSRHLALPPIVAAPATSGHRPDAPPPAAAVSLPPPPSPPTAITACDATGCWTREGTRLQRLGSQLLGPHGACTVVGSMAHCP